MSVQTLASLMISQSDHTASARTAPARAVLAINPGIGLDRARWPYVAFKGGSEPGVIDLTFLLRDASGRRVVCTATWNDAAKEVAQARFTSLVQRSIELADAGQPALPADGAGKK